MTIKYLARLQFRPGGPAVEGEWFVPGPAQDRYTEWIGRHGSHPTAVIQLIEENEGHRQVRKTWTMHGEVV